MAIPPPKAANLAANQGARRRAVADGSADGSVMNGKTSAADAT
jgi:hypothetical protein